MTTCKLAAVIAITVLLNSLSPPAHAQSCQSALASIPALQGLGLTWASGGQSATFGTAKVELTTFGACGYAAIVPSSLSLGGIEIAHPLVIVAKTAGNPGASAYPASASTARSAIAAVDGSLSFALEAGVNLFGVLDASGTGIAPTLVKSFFGSGSKAMAASPTSGFLQTISGSSDSVSVTFDLNGAMQAAAHSPLSRIPGFITMPTNLDPRFSIQHGPGGTEFAVQFEIDDLQVTVGGKALSFATVLSFQAGTAATDQATVGVQGIMNSQWQSPFGINGLTLLDSTSFEFTLAPATTEASVTFTGRAAVGDETVSLTASVSESAGALDAAAFEGSTPRLTLSDVVTLANAAIHAADPHAKQIPTSSLPAVELRSVDLAFASPGAQAASVGLTAAGTRLKADVYVSGQKAGNFMVDVDETGFSADGAADGLDTIGPLTVSNPRLSIASEGGNPPEVSFAGRMSILSVTDSIAAQVGPDTISVSMENSFGAAWTTDLDVRVTSLSGNPQVTVSGAFQSDFESWLMGQIKGKLSSLPLTTTTTIDPSFQQAVDIATTKLKIARAKTTNQSAKVLKAESEVQGAVTSAQDDSTHCADWVAHYRKERDSTSWLHPIKKAEYEADMLAQELECIAADAALATAQASLNSFDKHAHVFLAVDLNPAFWRAASWPPPRPT